MVRIQYMVIKTAVRFAAYLECGKFLCNGLIDTGEVMCEESFLCDIAKYVLSKVGHAIAPQYVDDAEFPYF